MITSVVHYYYLLDGHSLFFNFLSYNKTDQVR